MVNKYKVKINEKMTFQLNQEEVDNLDIIKETKDKYHILCNHKSYEAEIIDSQFDKKEYAVTINSNVYHIKISNPLDLLIEDMGFSMGSSKKLNYVKAPMPGIIIDIPVKKGDAVKEGDVLLVLEAMKMENAIICQKNSLVKEVYTAAGDKVEKGKLIIELE